MGVLNQVSLLFWKNFLLRIRSPGILVLELLWPVLVVGIISIMRLGAGPIKRGNCNYQSRAMPSAGAVQFLQTFVCNLNNKCYRSEQHLSQAEAFTKPFTDLTQNLGPLMASDQMLDILAISNKSVQVFDTMKKIVGDQDLLQGLDNVIKINSYFKDPDAVNKILVSDLRLLSQDQADALLGAQLNVQQLLNLTGVPDFATVACDPKELEKFIKFPDGVNIASISSSICNLNDSQIADLSNLLIREINVSTLINAMKGFESIKEALGDGTGLSFAMEAVAKMFEVVMSSESFIKTLGDISAIPQIADLIRKIPSFVTQYNDFNSIMKVMKEVINALKPLMMNLNLDQDPYWLIANDAVILTDHISNLVQGKWNGTSEEFIYPLTHLMENVGKLSGDDTSDIFMAVLDFITKNNWPGIYNEIIYNGTLSNSTINTMTKSMQDILQKTSIWGNFQNGLRLAYHSLDVFSILTETSIELRRSMNTLFSDKGFVVALNEILKYGPNVTNAFLEAIRNTNLIADIMRTATSYQYVCERVIQEIRGKVPDNIHTEMKDLLCNESRDAAQVLNDVTNKLNLDEISGIMMKIVSDVEKLYEGDFFTDAVQLTDFFSHYTRFTKAIDNYLYDRFSWNTAFDNFAYTSINVNERGWEPIADMLNGDYISSLLLAFYQGFGAVLGNSRISEEIGPGVHTLSELIEGLYGLLHSTGKLTSTESQLVEIVSLSTSYMPELVSGIIHIWNSDMSALYSLTSSPDPLRTFCDVGYVRMMNLPSNVPGDELNNLICSTDWNAFMNKMEDTISTMNSHVSRVANAFDMNETGSYNVEMDWINMVDYSSRFWDLIRNGEIAGIIDLTSSSVSFFNQLNFSRIEDVIEIMYNKVDHIEIDDLEKLLELGVRIIEVLDRNGVMSADGQDVRTYLAIVDAYLQLQLETTIQTQTPSSVSDIVKMYPKYMRTITVLLAKAYPQFVQALAKIVADPQTFINAMLTRGFQTPDCIAHFVMDYTQLPQDSAPHDLERFFCNLNLTDFVTELMEAQAYANISSRLTDLIMGNPTNVAIDYKRLASNLIKLVELYSSSMPSASNTGFDWAPFDITAINLSWQQFYQAARSLEQLDPTKIEELIAVSSNALSQLMVAIDGDEADVMNIAYAQSYINYVTMKLVTEELKYFNDSSEVIIFDYLGSDELRKLSSFLMKSPDINAVGVATLQRLLTSPQQAAFTFDFDALCSNVSLFKEIFVTDVSPLDPAILQKTVCNELITINITLVMDQVLLHRESFRDFLYAMSIFERNYTSADILITPDMLARESDQISKLLTDLMTRPPAFKITVDDSWMDTGRYAKAWEMLGNTFSSLGMGTISSPGDIEATVVNSVVSILELIPGSAEIFRFMSVIIDFIQLEIDQTNGDFVKNIRQYPNGRKVIDLLEVLPEAIQTVFYTVLTQPDKIVAWTEALQSWESFCATPSDIIFTVPAGIPFSMTAFKSKACDIDIEALGRELAETQGINMWINLFSNDMNGYANSSEIRQSMSQLVKSFTTLLTNPEAMAELDLRLVNVTLWDEVVERITKWAMGTGNSFMTNDDIVDIINEAIMGTRSSLPPEAADIFDKALAIAEVVISEMQTILNATSLDESFYGIPDMKTFIFLLNQLPELFESLLYTSINYPQQISAKLSGITSIEDFCRNKPEEILTSAPNSNLDLTEWMRNLCSVNITQFIEDIMQYKLVQQIQNQIEQPIANPPQLSSIIDKTEKLIQQFQGNVNLKDRLFNPEIWNSILENMSTWIWPYRTVEEFIAQQQQNLAVGILTYMENMPGTEDALKYLDATLDIIGKRTTAARENFPETFDGFPSLQIMARLLVQAPEMIETALFTILTQPDKTAAWSEALMSFSKFCSTPAAKIMMEPPGSNFNVTVYLDHLCSLDLEILVRELNSYPGIDRFNQIENGNDPQAVNVTRVTEKLQQFLGSLEDYYTNPLEAATFNLRLFNETAWNEIGQRIVGWSNSAMTNYGSEQSITDIISQFLGSIKEASPELHDAFEKALKITTVLANQLLDIMKEGSIQDAFKDIPSLKKLLELAESTPELFEVLVYTSVNTPEKVASRAASFMSLERFCMSQPETMFSLPPGSNFDLNGWFTQFCSMNITEIEIQLVNFKAAKDIDNIIFGSSNVEANLTAVVLKIENLVKQFSQATVPSDRFLSESIWSQVMARISTWISAEDFAMKAPYLAAGGFYLVMNQLKESEPAVEEMFRPVAAMMVVLEELMNNVLSLQNKTTIGFTDLVQGWTSMQQVLKFVQLPGILDVLIASSSSPTFSSLFSEQGLADFCSPGTNPAKYLIAPKSLPVDLSQMKSEFCSIDFENYLNNLDSFIDIQRIERVANGSIEYDWSRIEQKVTGMTDLINHWLKQPPTFDLPKQWTDDNYWQNLFDSQILPLEDSLMAKDQLQDILGQLGPLFQIEGFKQVSVVLNSVLDILNENIKAMQGADYTFKNMFEKIPAVKDLFDALGLDSNTIQSLLVLPVKNTTLFAEILMSDDMRKDFCERNKWNEIITFPDNFNTSSLYAAFCKNDIDTLLRKLLENYNLETMISILMDDKSQFEDSNWKNVSVKIFTLIENFEKLIQNPPTFNADNTMLMLNDNYNLNTLMELASVYSVLQKTFMNETEVLQPLSSAFSIAQVMVSFMNDIMARIKLQNGRLDLASLFKNVPEFQKLVSSVLNLNPDPVTGLFAVKLYSEKVDQFISMVSNETQLMSLFCSKKTFEQIFNVSPKVNISALLDVLCVMDFNSLAMKLSETFRVDSLTNEISTAMDSQYTFDEEAFTQAINILISHIMNLTTVDRVTFDGQDLGDIFNLNVNQLMEELNRQSDSLGNAFTGDYVEIASQVVSSVLGELKDLTDSDAIYSALRFMQAYLHSFNSFLKSVKGQPITLSLLLNNTEVGAILNPILTNPHSLDGLKDTKINIEMLSEFMSRPAPEDVLCGNELWLAINVTADTKQTLQDLQTNICFANQSLLLWQTVMMQANGYRLYQQIGFVEEDLKHGERSIDMKNVEGEMNEFISLMNTIISQYVNGSRSLENLVDVQSLMALLSTLQGQLNQQLLDTAAKWSVDTIDIILPQIVDKDLYQSMAKTLNTVNLFMNITIRQLHSIKDGQISASVLFNSADMLINIMEAYIRTGKNIAMAWSNNEFNTDKLIQLFGDMDQLKSLCAQPNGISIEISNSSPSQTTKDFSTVICSIIGTSAIGELKKFVDYDEIERMLMSTWGSNNVIPDYDTFVNNVEIFTGLLEDLSKTSFDLSSRLKDLLNFNSLFDNFANIAESPQMIFQLMKILGIVIENPLHNEQEVVKVLSQINSFALMPLVHILEALKAEGFTLINLPEDPDALLKILSVAVDFKVHFEVIKELAIKPQLLALEKSRNVLCTDADDEYQAFVKSRISSLQLPVTGADILTVVCNSSSSEWLKKFEDMGLTNIQMTVLLDQMLQSDLTSLYDEDFGWIRLLSSLEELTSLVAGSDDESKPDIGSIKTAWDHVKDLLFDKSFKSILSYLQLFEGSQPNDEGWLEFKQFLNFFTSVMKFLENNLEKANEKGVLLKDILPDLEQMSLLLDNVLGQQSSAEFLAAVVNPIEFYKLSMMSTWDDLCNESNTAMFSMYFQFPDGTNIGALKKSLCEAALTKKSSFQQLVSLLHADDMLEKLEMLINGRIDSSSYNASVWDATHAVMMKLIDTLENLQYISDDESAADYFMPIIQTFMSLTDTQNSKFIKICDSLVLYLNGTEDYMAAKQIISYVLTTTQLLTEMFTMVPDLDDVICALGAADKLDMVAFIQKLTDIGFMDMIGNTVTQYMMPPNSLQCSIPVSSSAAIIKVINATMDSGLINIPRIEMCFNNIESGIEDALSSVTNAANFLRSIGTVLQIPGIKDLFKNAEWMPIIDFVISTVNSNQMNTLLTFGDLLTDADAALQYFTSVLGLPDELIHSFLNATINNNWESILQRSVDEIEEILCDSTRLSKVITLPEGSNIFNMTDISNQLCIPRRERAAAYLKNISLPLDELNKLWNSTPELLKIITQLTNDVSKVIVDFQYIIEFLIDLLFNFNSDILRQDVDLIDEILQNDVLSQLGIRTKSILQGIERLVPDQSVIQGVFDDARNIIDGLMAIDFIKKATMESLKVKDLVADPSSLRSFMLDQLGIPDQQVHDILNGAFSFRVVLGLDKKAAYSCEDIIQMLIVLNDTSVNDTSLSLTSTTHQDLQNALCSLSTDQLKQLFDGLKVQLDIGSLVSKYVSYTADSVLKATNLTKTELFDVVEAIDRGQFLLTQATDTIFNNPSGSEIMELFEQGSAEAFSSMDQLTPLLCGEDIVDIFATDFTPGVVISTKDDLSQEIKDGVTDNIDDLPNEFCVDIYETVRKSSIGGILWAYLKPIMRGKILYTPVNDITNEIIRKTNKTFELLEEVERVANIWSSSTSDLSAMMKAANDTQDLRNALENDFIKGILEATIGVSPDSILTGLDALQANNLGGKELNALETAAKFISNISSCIEVNRFQGVDSEEELEAEAFRLTRSKTFFGGIVFLNTEDATNNNNGRRKRQSTVNIPKHVSYKIRMDVDNVMDTNHLKSSIWTMIAEDNFIEHMRYLRGFIHLQDMLDQAIIDIHKDPAHTIPGTRLKQIPFPCHHIDNFIFILGTYMVPVMMTFVFLASIGVATYNLVYDRENGQEQSLQLMGMMSSLHFIVWLISTMFIMAIVSLVMAVMLKYTDIFIYSNVFLLFLYILDFCLSSIMLLYMVSAFFNRTTMAILFVLMIYLISYLPYILVISMEVDMKFWQKIFACLASTTAFSFGAHNLAKLEEVGQGVQWNNIQTEAAQDFSLHWACLMMLIDSGIYFLIGWYVRHVKPGKYGIPQPWYFPVKPCFWSGCFNRCCQPKMPKERAPPAFSSLFEISPRQHEVGITIESLSKSYDKKQVLNNLSMNIYKGQITCLLGHNGAAKTTTLKMLYGMLQPSQGKIRINGKKPSASNNKLGMCPQQNTLFDYMTVLEHMKFYVGIKRGSSNQKTLSEIKKLLQDVDLWHERTIPVRNLSYGMKRRLCVALAFVGGSETVILDEPTSGIDPHARRNIWNLITNNKEGRTILLSTHHLDEADIIGDHIAIMHMGTLLCYGSPAFLKRTIGGGFKLSIIKGTELLNTDGEAENGAQSRPENQDGVILNFIKSMCPEATIVGQRGNDLWINLPKDEKRMTVPFQLFFGELDKKSNSLGIAGYGLSDTTMEEIFMKLTQKADEEQEKGIVNSAIEGESSFTEELDPEAGLSRDSNTANVDTKVRKQGTSLKFQQIAALIIKRFTHYHRNWRMILTCFLLPLVAFLIAIAFSTIRPDEGHSKALLMDPTIYGENTYTFFKKETKATGFKANILTKGFRNSNIGIGTTCMADYNAIQTGHPVTCANKTASYEIKTPFFMPKCEDARQTYYVLKDEIQTLNETLTPNQLYQQNLDARDNYKNDIPLYLMKTFKDYKDKRFGGWSIDESEDNGDFQVDPYVWFNSKGYHAMPSFFNSLSNVLLRAHLPNGENPDEYGITAINHPVHLGRNALTMKTIQNDAADSGIAIMVVLAFSFIPCGFMLYIIAERTQKEKLLQHISGVGLIMYWFTAFLWDMFVYSIAVGVAVGIVAIFETNSFYVRDNLSAFAVILLLYGWAILPFQYFFSHFFKKGSTAFLVSFCLNLFLAMATIITLLVLQIFKEDNVAWEAYKHCRYIFLIFPQYALGQGLMEMVGNTVKYEILKRFDEDFYENPYSFDILGWHMVSLAAFGLFFFIVNLLWQSKKSSSLSLPKENNSKNKSVDVDVAREKERILHSSNNDVLIVDDLSKAYRKHWKKFCAVDHVSFGVPEGESFGLLGVNGAGKTTTFRMLTGDLTSSYGTAMLNGSEISSKSYQLKQGVGYCPQEGGLDEYLTGTETLLFHARLKGFNKEQTMVIVEDLLHSLQLKPYADKIVHKYSGGTKRKLALAVAMLGNPPVLYLDEPTTGMDAGTRRLAWKCITRANRNGQSVVLTSHMMDECDALCSKIAIMVNGEIKCIGSPQHLKHRFGDGYTVIMHGESDLLGSVAHSFMNLFPGSAIQTRHYTSLQVMIPPNAGHVADILGYLQKAQHDELIEYYSLAQTTLDSVFISFAQDQSDRFYDSSSGSYTPSGSQGDTPTGSLSSSKVPPSYASDSDGKDDKRQVFMNPRFINDAYVNDEAQSRHRYVSNITLANKESPSTSTEYDNAPRATHPKPETDPPYASIISHSKDRNGQNVTNEEFVNDAFVSDSEDSQSKPQYVSNIAIRNNENPAAVYDNAAQSEPKSVYDNVAQSKQKYVSNIPVRNKSEPENNAEKINIRL